MVPGEANSDYDAGRLQAVRGVPEEVAKAMRITHYDHIALVCEYHANRRNPYEPGPGWAKRMLTQYECDGLVTPEQADDIRRACGWNVDAEQLRLTGV